MKFSKIIPIVPLVCLCMQAQAAEFWDGRVKVAGYLAQHWQSLEADGSTAAASAESGFSRLRLSLGFTYTVNERVGGYFEISEEPNDLGGADFGGGSGLLQDLGWIDIKLSPEVTFRTGNLVTTLHNYIPYSDGGIVQGNPLIGNSPIDFITAEEGAQIIGNHSLSGNSLVKSIGWDVAVSNARFFETGGFVDDQPYQFYGKLRFGMSHGFNIGGGVFFVDGSDQFTPGGGNGPLANGGGAASALFIGDGDNYNLTGTVAASRETHVALIPGVEATLIQLDAKWDIPSTLHTLRLWGGYAEDDWRHVDAGGTQTTALNRVDPAADLVKQDSELYYFGAEGVFRFNDDVYAAVRYSYADNDSPGAIGDTSLERIMIGAGWWFAERTLAKIEYVHQSEGDGGPGNINDDWDGVVGELSVSF